MTTLAPTLDLRSAFQQVDQDGAALIDDSLDESFLLDLRREASEVPFVRMAAQEGRAFQGGEQFHAADEALRAYPALQQLRRDLTNEVHQQGHAITGTESWEPNEVYVQRYSTGDLGITPHLDLKRYCYLVAIFTVRGAAPFTICKNREGDPLMTWQARLGSLILLRAPGLAGVRDGRPLHAVGGPVGGQRLSVSYRMDTNQ